MSAPPGRIDRARNTHTRAGIAAGISVATWPPRPATAPSDRPTTLRADRSARTATAEPESPPSCACAVRSGAGIPGTLAPGPETADTADALATHPPPE